MLQEDGAPAVIGDDVVNHLAKRLAARSLTSNRSQFSPGRPVVIERGPLRMVDAIFERQLAAPERVRILVQLLGRAVSVDVDSAVLRVAG
jgi:hypothetical protein